MKIHIIGCSGSGKTYLAKQLSEKFGIPRFDLDNIQWDSSADGYGIKMPPEKRDGLLCDILQNDNWIIEGVYYSWVGKVFEDADKIYVLDMPKYLYKFRIVRRSIRRKLGIEKGKKETLKSVVDLLKWTDTYQEINMPEIRKILEKYSDKVVWAKSKEEVNAVYK